VRALTLASLQAYGKVRIHGHSLLSQLLHPQEVSAALYFKFGGDRRAMPSRVDADVSKDENVKFCNEILGDVSRSFAAVIRQLPRELALDVVSLR
jgi:hypothetical protein